MTTQIGSLLEPIREAHNKMVEELATKLGPCVASALADGAEAYEPAQALAARCREFVPTDDDALALLVASPHSGRLGDWFDYNDLRVAAADAVSIAVAARLGTQWLLEYWGVSTAQGEAAP